MRRWLKRSLSLFLSLVLVLELVPTGLRVKAAEGIDPNQDLNKANGIVWLTKNDAGDSVSDEFSSMVQTKFLLDDMVREALGITDANAKVYFKGVDVGDPVDLWRNQSVVESLVDEMKESISNQYLVDFTINNQVQKIAFRNLKAAQIVVGEDNKIYIDHKGKPASADELKQLVADAMNSATVSVIHTGTVSATGIKTTGTKARYEGGDLVISNKQTYANLVEKWPTISSGLAERKAGTVTVTIYAAEYDPEYPDDRFKQAVTADVILRDSDRATVTVKAVAMGPDGEVSDAELAGYEYSYQAYVGDTMKADLKPVMDNYRWNSWDPELPTTVIGDATYFAVMEAKTDSNGNGLADQNEMFTITYLDKDGKQIGEPLTGKYGETTPEVAKPIAPEGKKYIWKLYDKSTGEGYGAWQPKVNGDVTYIAVLLEGPSVTGTLKFRGKSADPVELYTYLDNHDLDDGYKVEDPNWEVLAQEGYVSTGWYTLVPENSTGAKDLNRDGKAEELPFTMDSDLVYTANGSVELYYEFFTTKFDGYWADGSEQSPIYIYKVDVDGVVKEVELGEDKGKVDSSKFPAYKLGKYQMFGGWNYTLTEQDGFIYTYDVEPIVIDIESTVSVEGAIDTLVGPSYTSTYEIVEDGLIRYIWTKTADDYYEAYVAISGMTKVEPMLRAIGTEEKYNYLYDANTEITVSPIWKVDGNSKKIAFYVDDLRIDQGSILGGYTPDYEVFSETGKYADPADPEVTLYIDYISANFELEDTLIGVEAGKSNYSEKDIYEAIMDTRYDAVMDVKYAPDYNDDEITVQYLAREKEDVEIDLYMLYELFDAEGLGVLLNGVEILPKTYTVPVTEKWLNVSADVATEKTAQEVTDAFIKTAYEEQKAEKFANIEDFINNFLPKLVEEIDTQAIHKFGNNVNGNTEEVKIAYKGEKYFAEAKVDALPLEDDRIETYFDVKGDVTAFYGDSVGSQVFANVTLRDENGVAITDQDVLKALVTLDGEDARDYSKAGTGVYNNVVVAFKGNDTYQPATSDAFKLTVKKVEPIVSVDSMIAVQKGTDYYAQAAATVTPDAPIAQIVAGIAVDELKLDSSLALADNKIVIDAWVKLPRTYTELLDGLNLGDLNGVQDDVELPSTTIKVGTYYEKEHLEEVLEEYIAKGEVKGASYAQQILDMMDQIPERLLNRLGVNDMNYTLRIRLDALEDQVYPTEAGFYVNYAATLSTFTKELGSVDKNYGTADDYGFIVISPMLPIPNKGGVQLYDEQISDADGVYVFEYNGEPIVRDLAVSINGEATDYKPFYYGLTTRFDATKQAPTTPGVYFAGYIYTTEVYNEDSGEMEVRRLGSDSAVIIIKQREVDLEIKGGTYEYDGANHIAEVIVTDKNGTVVNDAGATVISGTANVNTGSTNVTINDLYGTVNVDFPDALQNKWDAYCNRIWGKNAQDEFTPSDVISFLEECADAAESAANGAIEEFKALALDDTVSAALDKINGKQDKVDVSSGNLVNKAERVQDLMQGGRAYFDRLIAELEPLKAYDNNVFVTFYDLEDEADKLDYSKTGYYLYMGLTTDPDVTISGGKALVIIHSADDYIMRDTHVPYDGQPHDIYTVDETKRGDVTAVLYPAEDGVVAINREKKEVHIQVDDELAEVICDALNLLCEEDLSVDSDVYVGTVYTKTKDVADELTKEIMNVVKTRAVAKITADYPQAGAPLENAHAMLEVKLDVIYDKLLAKLQELDQLENGTKIVISDLFSFDLGTYEVTTFDFDVNEINIQLDDDAFKALKAALAKKGYQLNEGSDGYVITGYEKFEDAAAVITETVFDKITDMANAAFDKTPYDTPEELKTAMEILQNKILAWKDRFSTKLQQVDGFDNYTRIVINGELPVEVGTYEFYGYDYDVSATRGQLVIEPIYIVVEDEDAWKYVGETDPALTAKVSYYSYSGIAPETVAKVDVTLPAGVAEDDVVEYDITRETGEEIGLYDMSVVDLKLLEKSGNYVLAECEEDKDDFEIRPYGTIEKGSATLSLEGEVYIEYFPVLTGFDGINLTNKGGLIISRTPKEASELTIEAANNGDCAMVQNMYYSTKFNRWAVTTTGINAKEYGDVLYMRPFIEINGVVMYGEDFEYSAEQYCRGRLEKSTNPSLKNVCAALLEYGAAAQIYFDYKADSEETLVNYGLDLTTKYDLAYSTDMIDTFERIDDNALVDNGYDFNGILDKVGTPLATLTLEGAVVIKVVYPNVELDPSEVKEAKLLVWTEEDYDPTGDFNYDTDSCTFSVPLNQGVLNNKPGYVATLKNADPSEKYVGIPLKECGDPVYFMAYFKTNNDEIYCSPLKNYSPDTYINSKALKGNDLAKVCEALAVVSEKARVHFGYKVN